MTTDGRSFRWAFNTKTWIPTEEEWLLASRCIPLEEKERIQRFVFKADAKASMAGWLMMRKLAHQATGDPYDQVCIVRDKNGRPIVKNAKVAIDFNVSHQGSYTVLAGEVHNDMIVGVDIMSLPKKSDHELSELFRLLNRSFSNHEWQTILASDSKEKQSDMFFRHWCLKESYTKALGVGICTDLRRISFHVKSSPLSLNTPCVDTTVHLDGIEKTSWKFHEWLLDSNHCVSVALSSRSSTCTVPHAVPFSELSWLDLTAEAQPLLPPDVNYCRIFMQKVEDASHL